ncbi:MAG: DUF3310 domain-containing protein [Acidobacteriia bacterium]|nr:DUF3310 domain-containing protein [Terriglobia bacterium]
MHVDGNGGNDETRFGDFDYPEGEAVRPDGCPSTKPKKTHARTDDPINHPSHYTSHPSGVECIQITEHMDFLLGNALKYLWRSGLKDGVSKVQDLEKARWYIERAIAKEKR